jgi:hypothetical protein
MSDKEPNALILPRAYGVQQLGSGSEGVVSRIVGDALALARAREPTRLEALIRVGNFEFREQDYRQLLNWAAAAEMRPDKFINALQQAKNVFWDGTSFVIEDGRIVQVAFPPNLLRSNLDLSNAPYLTRLKCDYNNLLALDLTHVPKLRELYCEGNRLSKIDLSNVAKLEILCCGKNSLSSIDLSNVPELITLSCGWNRIKALILPKTLLKLSCVKTELQNLDLEQTPRIDYLACDSGVELGPADKVLELIRYKRLER